MKAQAMEPYRHSPDVEPEPPSGMSEAETVLRESLAKRGRFMIGLVDREQAHSDSRRAMSLLGASATRVTRFGARGPARHTQSQGFECCLLGMNFALRPRCEA
jgi:hypothetical protein